MLNSLGRLFAGDKMAASSVRTSASDFLPEEAWIEGGFATRAPTRLPGTWRKGTSRGRCARCGPQYTPSKLKRRQFRCDYRTPHGVPITVDTRAMDVNPERRAARQAALDAVEAAFPVREDSSFSELQAMNRELEAANRDMESLLMETAPSFVQPVSDAPTPGDRTPPDMENPRIGLGATIVILPTGDGGFRGFRGGPDAMRNILDAAGRNNGDARAELQEQERGPDPRRAQQARQMQAAIALLLQNQQRQNAHGGRPDRVQPQPQERQQQQQERRRGRRPPSVDFTRDLNVITRRPAGENNRLSQEDRIVALLHAVSVNKNTRRRKFVHVSSSSHLVRSLGLIIYILQTPVLCCCAGTCCSRCWICSCRSP